MRLNVSEIVVSKVKHNLMDGPNMAIQFYRLVILWWPQGLIKVVEEVKGYR